MNSEANTLSANKPKTVVWAVWVWTVLGPRFQTVWRDTAPIVPERDSATEGRDSKNLQVDPIDFAHMSEPVDMAELAKKYPYRG